MTQQKRKPKGDHFVAMLVGGDHKKNFLPFKMAAARAGVHLRYHWNNAVSRDNVKKKTPYPPDVDVVAILKDTNLLRKDREALAYQAKQHSWGLQVEPNWREVIAELEHLGFSGQGPLDLAALEGEAAPDAAKDDESPAPPAELRLPKVGPRNRAEAGAIIKAARIAAGYQSCKALGVVVGVSDSLISSLERGTNTPSDEVLDRVERLVQVPNGTYPRMATRHNRRVGKKPLGAPEPVVVHEPRAQPAPVPEPVVEAPVVTAPAVISTAAVLETFRETAKRVLDTVPGLTSFNLAIDEAGVPIITFSGRIVFP